MKHIMGTCLICKAGLDPFMSFGKMPIANGFLSPEQFASEYFYELRVGFCPYCMGVQLVDLVDREKLFHEKYAFFSSTSNRMAAHFKEFAERVMAGYLKWPDPLVVEIGSNDGILLQHLAQKGIRHVGIEPSANVARLAVDKGVNTIVKFFDESLAREIVAQHGQADAFLAANVMCHIPYLHSVVAGIRILLKPTGIVMFEDPYLGDILAKTAYDQIYDEHAFYFSVSFISRLFAQHGMELIDIIPQNVHGGSMRYVIAHQGAWAVSPAVAAQVAQEKALGLHLPETYERLRCNIERSRDELRALLSSLKQQGKRMVGYAATSKSTTVINYCEITSDWVEFISDTTPTKQGKYSPGAHIPVRPYQDFVARYPDYALLFAWNHAEEIMANERPFIQGGGKFILYVPSVKIV